MKQHEVELMQYLVEWGIHWTNHDSGLPCAPVGCHKRPDFVFHLGKWVIVLECDEDFHRNYEISCEIARIGIIKDRLKLPLLLIRFNPGVKAYIVLKDVFSRLLTDNNDMVLNEYGIHVVYIGYPAHRIQELNEYTTKLCGMPFPSSVL